MESIASELKAQRENRKISLSQIAADTRISLRHLQSLEEGRFNDLPGGMYNRAFLRAYCESLNLDQAEILRRYEAEVLPHPEKPAKSKSHIPSTFRIHPVMIWSLMLVVSGTGIFLSRKWIGAVFSPYFSGSSGAQVSNLPPKQPEAAPQRAPLPAPLPEPAEVEAAAPDAAAGALPATAPTPAAGFRLEVTAKEKCWVSINSDGSPVFSRVIEPGETQSFSAAQSLSIKVGNAGGVSLRINGKSAKPLGKPGEVINLLINETTLPDLIDRSAG